MSGTTMSTPSSSDSGNMRPASMTMMSSPQRTAMQFMPNSPRPPSGITWSLPAGIETSMLTDRGNRESREVAERSGESWRVKPQLIRPRSARILHGDAGPAKSANRRDLWTPWQETSKSVKGKNLESLGEDEITLLLVAPWQLESQSSA